MIERLETDEWDKRNNVGILIENPSLFEIVDKLNKLDGVKLDTVTLYKNTDEFLAVGGGNNGKYVLSIITIEKTFELSNEGFGENRVLISVGGQDGEFPEYMIVNKATVEQAVKYYYENGLPDPDLNWRSWDGSC